MFTKSAAFFVILTSCAVGIRAIALQNAPKPSETFEDSIHKDVETMRRLLDKTIAPPARKSGSTIPLFSAHDSAWIGGGSEAYYARGGGFVYTGSVSVPLFPADTSKQQADSNARKEPSAWDEARAEVEGRPSPRRVREVQFDTKEVDAMKEAVIRAMGSYAGNIRGLGDDEWVTVILRGRSNVTLDLNTRRGNAKGSASVGDGADAAPAAEPVAESEFRYLAFAGDLEYSVFGSGGEGGRTVLTLSVQRKDCDAFASGSLKYEDFAQRVKTTQYRTKGRTSALTTLPAPSPR